MALRGLAHVACCCILVVVAALSAHAATQTQESAELLLQNVYQQLDRVYDTIGIYKVTEEKKGATQMSAEASFTLEKGRVWSLKDWCKENDEGMCRDAYDLGFSAQDFQTWMPTLQNLLRPDTYVDCFPLGSLFEKIIIDINKTGRKKKKVADSELKFKMNFQQGSTFTDPCFNRESMDSDGVTHDAISAENLKSIFVQQKEWKTCTFHVSAYADAKFSIDSSALVTITKSSINFEKVILFAVALILFLSAPYLSHSVAVWYASGAASGTIILMVLMCVFASRKIGGQRGAWGIGVMATLYYSAQNYWDEVKTPFMYALLMSAFLGFGYAYTHGPIDEKKQDLLQWFIQAVSVAMMWSSVSATGRGVPLLLLFLLSIFILVPLCFQIMRQIFSQVHWFLRGIVVGLLSGVAAMYIGSNIFERKAKQEMCILISSLFFIGFIYGVVSFSRENRTSHSIPNGNDGKTPTASAGFKRWVANPISAAQFHASGIANARREVEQLEKTADFKRFMKRKQRAAHPFRNAVINISVLCVVGTAIHFYNARKVPSIDDLTDLMFRARLFYTESIAGRWL